MKVKNAHQRDFILAFFAVARAKLRKPSVQKHEKVPVFWSIFTVADPPAGRGQEKKKSIKWYFDAMFLPVDGLGEDGHHHDTGPFVFPSLPRSYIYQ